MLTQDRHEGSARPASKKQSRHPAKFMFIDSSNGGVNAKPDRVVRSFVMKSARNKKTWSTRPKSPKEEELIETLHSGSVQQIDVQQDQTFAVETWNSQNYRKDSVWDGSSLASPASSRNGSIFSAYSSTRTCDSPPSGYTSPFNEHNYADCAHNFQVDGGTKLTLRDGFDIRFTRSLDCLSVHLDGHAQQLLHQFVGGSAPRLIPIDLHSSSSVAATDWIAGCIQSPSGAPYIYAALTASARSVGLSSEAYKWRAITEVNKLLSDPKTGTDDTTIATVLVLLALEESDLADPKRRGSDREWSLSVNNAHLNGLRTMIEQRGGLVALSANRCLQVFILMHSVAQCITSFKRPYALLLDSMDQVENYGLASQQSRSRISFPASIENLNLDLALQDIIYCIHLFSSDLDSWYTNGQANDTLDPFELQKHASLLMYRLFDWYQLGAESEISGLPGRHPFDQSICLGYLIYMVLAIEPHAQSSGSRLWKTVAKLRQALQRVPVLHWATVPDLFFWTLTMGALGATGLPRSQQSCASEFAFFVQFLQLSFAPSGHNELAYADDLLHRIQHYPWIPLVFDARVRRLWARMGLCRADVINLEESSSEEEETAVDDEHAVGQSTTARFFPALRTKSKKSSLV